MAATIAKRSTLSNWLGAKVATFKYIPNRANLAFRCAYLFKAPTEESGLTKAILFAPRGTGSVKSPPGARQA